MATRPESGSLAARTISDLREIVVRGAWAIKAVQEIITVSATPAHICGHLFISIPLCVSLDRLWIFRQTTFSGDENSTSIPASVNAKRLRGKGFGGNALNSGLWPQRPCPCQ